LERIENIIRGQIHPYTTNPTTNTIQVGNMCEASVASKGIDPFWEFVIYFDDKSGAKILFLK
jgi:hypothetical protein